MNRNRYRTIFSQRLGMLIAVAEITRTRSSGSALGGRRVPDAVMADAPGNAAPRGVPRTLVALAVACGIYGQPALAAPPLPTGGTITQGTGTITQSGNTLTVNQSSQNLVANWQSFNIGSGNAVTFKQPGSSSVALNRVTGPDASSIYGSLSANGKVFLVNPNGVLFAPGSQVSVGGLVASTLGISDADFAAGHYRFTQGNGATGTVTNQGSINAGSVALIGPQVTNSGTIATPGGKTTLAAGQQVTVELLSNGLLTAQVDVAAANAQVQNHGKILADGGSVSLQAGRADTVLDSLINTDGVIQAHSIRNENGSIYLDGGAGGTVTVGGTVDSSGSGAGAHGGNVTALGKNVGLMAGAEVNASGDTGGGTVLIGGNWQGSGPEHHAQATYMDPTATIHADATGSGDGGKVVLWSDQYTGFYGSISARGGSQEGNGGEVETSSHDNLQAFGHVDAAAPAGTPGHWLLDPTDVTIVSGSTNSNDTDSGGTWTPTTNTAQIGVSNINADLNAGTSVTINTASAGTAAGSITQNSGAPINKTAGGDATLTLNAAGSIALRDSITSSAGQLAVTLNAGSTVSGSSSKSINTNGGLLTINTGSGTSTFQDVIAGTGGLLKTGAGTLSLSGNNTNTGQTTISAGTLQVLFGTLGTGNIVMNDGNTGSQNTSFTVGAAASGQQNLIIANQGSGTTTFNIIGSTGAGSYSPVKSITVNRAATLNFAETAPSFYNFATPVSGSGPLTLAGGSAYNLIGPNWSGYTGPITIAPGGAFDFRSTLVNNNPMQVDGTLYVVSTGGFSNTTIGALTGSGTITTSNTYGYPTGSGINTLVIGADNGSGTFSGTFTEDPIHPLGIQKIGTGTETLAGSSTQLTLTTIGAGVLALGNANALASSNITFTGGTLQHSTANTTDYSARIVNSTGPISIDTNGQDVSYTGALAASNTGGLTKLGAGTLTLSGTNVYTGPTTISAGTLQAGSTSAFGNNSAVIDNATLDLNGFSNSIGSLAGSGVVTDSSATAATLTLGSNNTSTTFSGVIQDGAGMVSIAKVGSGTETFVGTNTYSGSTSVNAGTLQIAGAGTLGSGNYASAVTNNGTLQYSSTANQTLAGAISGSGSIIKDGSGTLTLSGTNTYSGTTAVNAGTLAITNASALGDTNGGTTVAGGAILDLQNVAVGSESLTLASGSPVGSYATLSASVGTSSWAGPLTSVGSGSSTFDMASGAQLTVSGIISGSGGLLKQSAGTLVLTAANTYAGLTSIKGGTLAITNDQALGVGTGGIDLKPGGTLDLRNVTLARGLSGNGGAVSASTGVSTIQGGLTSFQTLPVHVLDGAQLTMAGVLTGSLALVKDGGGTLILTGNNASAGTTTVNAGTLQVGNGGTTGTLDAGTVTVASGANLIFNRSNTVSLSTLASNAGGITGAGNVTALIGGGFTVDRPITLTGANSSILLEAGKNQLAGDVTGGNVTLNSAIKTSATGTVTIFSGNANTAALEARVSGATGATRYKTYDASASDTSGATAGTRNYYYRQAPGTLRVIGLTASKVYDGLLDASSMLNGSTAAVSGLLDGDTTSPYSALTLTGASFASAHAGPRALTASFTGLAAPTYSGGGVGWSVSGYAPTTTVAGSGTGTITPRPITSTIDAVGKTYDGLTTTSSTLTAPAGFIGNDGAASVGGLGLAFDDPNAGTRNVVASGTGSLVGFTGTARGNGSGVGAGNEVAGLASDYAVATPSPVSAVINPAALTITANNDAKIVTQSDAPGYNGASYSGFVHGESSTDLSGSLSITRSNAGTEGAGTYAGVLVPSGQSSGNYAITYANGDYQIVPAQQLLVKIANVTGAYGSSPGYVITSAEYLDGSGASIHTLTQTAQSGNNYTYSDGLGGAVTFTVSPQGSVTSGAGYLATGNYVLSGNNTHITGNNFLGMTFVGNEAVTPLGIAPTPTAGVSKVYDGSNALTGLTMDFSGKLSGDAVLVDGNGSFSSKNAGSNIGYDINGMVLSGADAGNYYLTAGNLSGTNGTITPKSITVGGVSANDKVYDGTTTATLTTGGASLSGVVAGDAVGLDAASYSALFDTRNVGTGKAVTVSGLGLGGADAGNYVLDQPTGLSAGITPRQLTVSAVADTKTYDGTMSSTLTPTIDGLVASDSLSGTAVQGFDNRNVGTGKTLMASMGSLVINDGNGGNNYALTFVNDDLGVITPRPLTVTALSNSKAYDGTTSATGTPAVTGGLVGGDRFTLLGERFTSAQIGTGLTLMPLVGIDDGNGGANYAVTLVDNTQGEIYPAVAQLSSSQVARLNGDSAESNYPGAQANRNASVDCGSSDGNGSKTDETSTSASATPAPDNIRSRCVAAGEPGAMIQVISTGIRLPQGLKIGDSDTQRTLR